MKVALVCDWLTGGGAERVVKALHDVYPGAPIYTSYISPAQKKQFDGADIQVLWTGRFPGAGKLRKFLPILREKAFEKLDLSDYDVVISVSGAEAKGVRTGDDTLHICYCLSPTHYYWVRYEEYLANPGFGAFNGLARIGLRLLVGGRRKWDFAAAQRPNIMVGISTEVQKRITKYYKRDSRLIFPAVDVERFKLDPNITRHGFVTAGRQAPYKRFDLAVAAANKTGQDLKVIGRGPEHDALQALAGPTVTLLDNVSDKEMVGHFQTAEAFLFTSDEDFGITPVEAMACGTPVIALRAGGALDTVIDGQTGLYFDKQTGDSLAQVLSRFNPRQFKPEHIRQQAERFSTEQFTTSFQKLVNESLKKRT